MLRIFLVCCACAFGGLFVGCGEEKQESPAAPVVAEIVNFTTDDGIKIVGTWFAAPNSKISLVLIPAVSHSRGTWMSSAQEFAASGWSVLAIDMRDQGDSVLPRSSSPVWVGSDTLGAIRQYVNDVRAGVKFVHGKTPGAKIIAMGAGIGGYCGLHEAISDPSVVAVALFSPPESKQLSASGVMAQYGDRPLLMLTELPAEAIRTTPRTLDSWIGRGSALAILNQTPQPPKALESKHAAAAYLNQWIAKSAH
jgi:alpha-beta hydrolase superfamily lysophospholipase